MKWINSLPDPAGVSVEEVNRDDTCYLLPEYSHDNEEEALITDFYDLIFEEQLMGWWTEESDWPANRSLTLFKEWFDVEFHSVVLDLVDAPLEHGA